MTPSEFVLRLKANKEALMDNRRKEAFTIALDLVAQIKLRIQSRGQNFMNQPFSPYTKQYAKQRAKGGFQTGFVDFTRTGRLMANVQPEVIAETEETTTIRTTARDQENIDKLRGAASKRGNILIPSKDEIELALLANQDRIQKYLSL